MNRPIAWTHFVASQDATGQRLESYLSTLAPILSRTQARQAIADGRVRLNNHKAAKGDRLKAGDAIAVDAALLAAAPLANPSLPLEILYEDKFLLAVNKPAGMDTHPLAPDEKETLVNGLLARFPEIAGVGYGVLQPGIVHRLDRETSGVILVARNAAVFSTLQHAAKQHSIKKDYVALVHGQLRSSRSIEMALAADPGDRRKMITEQSPKFSADQARAAHTQCHAMEIFGDFSFVNAGIYQGARHQIRCHLAAIGHPIAGDVLYGPSDTPRTYGRHFLHAATLTFRHPITEQELIIESPLASELANWLQLLRSH